ncbi:hypothetical protein BC941DRAFT_37011 [Chlamydoabsidia padenii]|nr:hypothetical protein BC941DRAFT_37011 [Chlamydoabsidia padenii]
MHNNGEKEMIPACITWIIYCFMHLMVLTIKVNNQYLSQCKLYHYRTYKKVVCQCVLFFDHAIIVMVAQKQILKHRTMLFPFWTETLRITPLKVSYYQTHPGT